uniref:ATP-dependent RNA helicase n=1 Tax=Microcebus murinus TaxID=30608 RepID=A0A8C5VPF3_MICMU
VSHLPMKLLRKKMEKRNLKLRQRNLKLQGALNVSLSEIQNGDISEETTGGGKVKKSLKQSMKASLSKAQNGHLSEETVENVKVKKSPQKSTILTNGQATMQSPNSESKKKRKKKKRKMANDSGPDAKKAKTENKGAEAQEETENKEDDNEVLSLPLELTGAFEDTSFTSLTNLVNANTLKAIKEMGFINKTEIQHKSITPLLEGRDLLAAAKTGSGRTLAFLISAVELIVKLKFMPRNGTGVLILSPTRELAMQTFRVLKELMTHHVHTYGLIMGGSNRSAEAQKLAHGINITVAIPGHLLDHMQNTPGFMYKNLQCLVIDEADRILDVGFEEELKQIIKLLPIRRQTMLFSATQTRKVEDLARISLKKEPLYVGVDDDKTNATVDGLEQGYVVCPSEKRFLLLFTFLKKNRKKKLMVFFSSCMSVKYHYELLNYIDLPVLAIHGRQKHNKRTTTFFQFYCYVRTWNIFIVWVEQPELEQLIEKNYFLHKSAQEAYKSYIRAYDSHSLKQIFNVNNLNLPQVALSFGFKVPPFVDLNVNSNEGKHKKRGGGGGFGYQKSKKVEKSKIFKNISKKSSDRRQFSH